MADMQIRNSSATAAREIKASAHYTYIEGGITLDGSKFTKEELVLEGTCLVKDDVTGKYEKYSETTPGTFEPGKSNPVILDDSIKFKLKDDGNNPDVIVGQIMVHGSVHEGMLIGCTDAFKTAVGGRIMFV